jgi:hypothetical protein
MPIPIFSGTVIAIIWDFDQTLIPGYQEEPLFRAYGVDATQFWAEVRELVGFYAHRGLVVSSDTVYLNHILTYVKEGPFAGLSNVRLRQLGAELPFHPGMPEFMDRVTAAIQSRPESQAHDITVEHYIVSTGLRQMILGSKVAPHVKGVWASEFIEEAATPGFLNRQASLPITEAAITQVGYFVDNTSKTRAIWEINKGVNIYPEQIDVNSMIAPGDRRVPLKNMIYVADGPSDIPVFSILNQYGGRTLGVYNPGDPGHFKSVKSLRDQDRVQHFAEADYREGSNAAQWIMATLEELAMDIVESRKRAIKERVHPSVGHTT